MYNNTIIILFHIYTSFNRAKQTITICSHGKIFFWHSLAIFCDQMFWKEIVAFRFHIDQIYTRLCVDRQSEQFRWILHIRRMTIFIVYFIKALQTFYTGKYQNLYRIRKWFTSWYVCVCSLHIKYLCKVYII